MDGRDRRPLERRQEDAPQRIAEGKREAALERLGDHGRETLGIVAGLDLELVGLGQFLPILLDHGVHLSSMRTAWPERHAIG